MAFFTKKADPAQAAVDRQATFSCMLGMLILLAPILCRAQFAANTSISQIPYTNVFNLTFVQPSPSISLAGVEFYVVVEGEDPKITLQVPESSWIFEEDDTDLSVGSPTVVDEVYWFPIEAWRPDNVPQSGYGLYLQVVATDGIVIAIEDFPTKLQDWETQLSQGHPSTPNTALQDLVEIRVTDLSGRPRATIRSEQDLSRFQEVWAALPTGVYLITATTYNQTTKSWKACR